MMGTQRVHTRAFTLLELMVASSITLIILTAATSLMLFMVSAVNKENRMSDTQIKLREVSNLLLRDMQGISGETGNIGDLVFVVDGGANASDELTVFRRDESVCAGQLIGTKKSGSSFTVAGSTCPFTSPTCTPAEVATRQFVIGQGNKVFQPKAPTATTTGCLLSFAAGGSTDLGVVQYNTQFNVTKTNNAGIFTDMNLVDETTVVNLTVGTTFRYKLNQAAKTLQRSVNGGAFVDVMEGIYDFQVERIFDVDGNGDYQNATGFQPRHGCDVREGFLGSARRRHGGDAIGQRHARSATADVLQPQPRVGAGRPLPRDIHFGCRQKPGGCMKSPLLHNVRRQQQSPRGYALLFVMVLGVIFASLSAAYLWATARDNIEARAQLNSTKALYAAEAGVAVGIETVRKDIEDNIVRPDFSLNALGAPTLPDVTFPLYKAGYFQQQNGTLSPTYIGGTSLEPIASGVNQGLYALQTPIQVLATAKVGNASSTVADAIRLDLIPVFQFAMFTDGDLEFLQPAPMKVSGRVHANGDVYFSNGNSVSLTGIVTSAKQLFPYSAASNSVTVGGSTNQTFLKRPNNAMAAVPTGTAALNVQTWLPNVKDKVNGQTVLKVPVSTSAAAYKVASRPSICGDGAATDTRENFTQSAAIELIKRAAADYAVYGSAPSADTYDVKFGTKAMLGADGDAGDLIDQQVVAPVPLMVGTEAADAAGARDERLYWKANIRIIDGIWYKKGSNVPVFDPETWDMSGSYTLNGLSNGTAPANVLQGYRFARVLRHSWFWDARESREYNNANKFQRGLQVRTTDVDIMALNLLLENADARTLLGLQPSPTSKGIIVYVSETYDHKNEDDKTQVNRTANVRNYLDFSVMDNSAAGTLSITGQAARTKGGVTPRPDERGWHPAALWGDFAPAGHRSLTKVPAGFSAAQAKTFQQNPLLQNDANSYGSVFFCQEPAQVTSPRVPGNRPASFKDVTASTMIPPPCIQNGATPLGAENAVRLVRAQTVPIEGLTVVSDNRVYLHGDVNIVSSAGTGAALENASNGNLVNTLQELPGSVAVMADSVTLLSQAFSDRVHQRGGVPGGNGLQQQGRFSAISEFVGALPAARPWSAEAPTEDPIAGSTLGHMPNMCTAESASNHPNGKSLRAAVATRFNVSLLMGDVPACVGAGDNVGNKSGGINNFPRFLENWSGVDLVVHGSMVSLFRSERGNARFLNSGFSAAWTANPSATAYPDGTPCIYTPPNRIWGFDTGLTDINNLPPGTPKVVATDRLRWVRR
jgi:Tfp pilus assembly protein PilW